MRVLLVESNPGDVDLVRTLAKEAGPVSLEFESVARLDDALAHLREKPFDLVLLDLGLPDSQGLDTFHKIRQAAPRLPVVLLTGNDDQELGVAAVKAGAQDYLIKGEAGGPTVVRAMMYAVERKRAQEELREQEERLHCLFETTQDSVFILDQQSFDILDVNPAACRLYGYSRDEFLHLKATDVSAKPEVTKTAILSETTEALLCLHRKKSGEVFPVELSLGYFTFRGRALHTAFVRDISERRQLQATIAQSDRLASMGMLAAGVAHEINNPLSYVLYNLETLTEDLTKLTPAVHRCCAALRRQVGEAAATAVFGNGAGVLHPAALDDTLHRSQEALSGAQRIKEIARGLGTFARVERVEQSKIDLRYSIECAASMATNEIKFRATLVKDFGQVPRVMGSEGKLSQVFLNLILNAACSIPEGHAATNRIGVRTWANEENVFAEVTDTGEGISPENLQRIFDPFFTTKAVGLGSGLGLAICKNILAEMGGDIQVESEIGRGTRFIVCLPVPRDMPKARSADVDDASPTSAIRGRILVVDDEEAIRRMLKRMLGQEHDIVTAASGVEARAIIEQDPGFDLIICDLMMPSMSGMDLHKWLVGHDPAFAERVVFLSGGAFTPKAAEYLARVENTRLDKPVDKAELVRLAREHVIAHRFRA